MKFVILNNNMLKNISTIIIFYLLSFNAVLSATFNWTIVPETGSSSSQAFYDKKTVFFVGEYVYFWQLTNNLEDIDDGIYSVITHNMANCDTYELRVISYSDYKKPMGKGSADLEMIIPEVNLKMFDWRYFDRNKSIQGAVLDKVCK